MPTKYQAISSVNYHQIDKGVKFDRSARDHPEQEIPIGPGAYNTNLSSFKPNGGKFNRSKKDRAHSVDPIGPGAYNSAKSEFGNKKGFTIPGRHTFHGDDERPGPGQYNYGKYLDKQDWSHGIKLPRAGKRDIKPATDVGPGGYDIKDKKDGGFSFGKDKNNTNTIRQCLDLDSIRSEKSLL